MKVRLYHVLAGILLLSIFGCSKELSKETFDHGAGNNTSGNFHAKIDGASWVADDNTKSATVVSGLINISGVSDNKSITITLIAQSTGTYPLSATSTGLASYDDISAGISYATNQSGDPAQSGGTVTITEIDETNKTISGTFSFNGFDGTSGVIKVVSEGVFDKLSYSTTLPPASLTDTFKVKIAGTNFVASSISASIVTGSLFVQGAALDGTNFTGLYMPQDIQPGSYPLDITTGTYIGQFSPDPSTILVSQADGTLVILENNTTTKRIKGRFNFTASDMGNVTSVKLTEGYFSVKY